MTRALLGSVHTANAISQEKTGEFWVAKKMVGGFSRGNFEHCEVGVFLGKNPWFSHGIPHARLTLREIANDPKRCLIVIDPRRTETADIADIHLQVKPGGDAFLLAAMIAVIVQEGLLKRDWLAEHADGLEQVLPHFTSLDVAAHAAKSGVPEEQVRAAARRIAAAESVATFEDLGVQMNLHSTLVSYLHKLLVLLTGNFGKKGAEYRPTTLVPQAFNGEENGTTPVTGSRIIGGLTPCNVVPDEILTDHPKRFRAMLVESGNPAHSIADGVRMREALAALELVVVIDVAFTETARLADYVLPVASQFEKAEAVFFNFEFPNNYFFLRKPLMPPLPGLFSEAELHARIAEALGELPKDAVETLREAWLESRVAFRSKFFELVGADRRLLAVAPVLAYRAIGDLLPEGLAEGAAVWVIFQVAAPRIAAVARARRIHRLAAGGGRRTLRRAAREQERDHVLGRRLGGELRPRCHAQRPHSARDPGAVRRARRPRERAGARERGLPARPLRRRAPLVHGEHDHSQSGVAEEGSRRRVAHASRRREARRCCGRRPRAALDAARQRGGLGRDLGPHAARAHLAAERARPRFPGCGRRTRRDGRLAERADAQRGPRLGRGYAVAQAHAGARGGAVSAASSKPSRPRVPSSWATRSRSRDIVFAAELALFSAERASRRVLSEAALTPLYGEELREMYPRALAHFARLCAHAAFAPDLGPYLEKLDARDA